MRLDDQGWAILEELACNAAVQPSAQDYRNLKAGLSLIREQFEAKSAHCPTMVREEAGEQHALVLVAMTLP